MKNYAGLFYFYTSTFGRFLRFVFLFSLLIFSLSTFLNNPDYFKFPFCFILLYFAIEIFFQFKIYEIKPKVQVLENDGKDIFRSFTLDALRLYFTPSNSLTDKALRVPIIRFISKKTDLEREDLKIIKIGKDELAKNAFELVKSYKGKFVTSADIFASYLLLSEDKTKALFNKKIKKEELLQILYWAKMTYPSEEQKKEPGPGFWGEGIADEWVSGWTIETKKYAVDLTPEILRKNFTPFNRENDFQKMEEALLAGKSVLLVGEPGSGRNSLIQSFAFDSFMGKLKGSLYHQKLFQLMVDSFLAGAGNQGEVEERLTQVIAELAHSGNVMLFVQDLENILGNPSYKLDLSSTIIPCVEKGAIRILATTTPGAFKKFIENKHELLSSFEVIKVEEPDEKTAMSMLFRDANWLEEKMRIYITYRSVVAALEYGSKYNKDMVLPGNAALLLKDAASSVLISARKVVEEEDIVNQTEKETNIPVGEPTKQEKEILINLEERIHQRVIDQEEAVTAVSEAMRRIRTGMEAKNKPISFLFLGPTGVGKTETAKALAASYFGSDEKMIRLDMSEYSSKDAQKRLLGAMPGEDEDRGELTDKVYENPGSLVLLDEFEKADQSILDLFLQILDDGRLTDNKGKTVYFAGTIIIATSNAASEFIREEVEKGTSLDKDFRKRMLEFLQTKGIFKPELLNRFDGIIVFKPLGNQEVTQIVKLLLLELSGKLKEKDIEVTFDEKVVQKISSEGFDKEFGARPLRRFIQDNIEDSIAKEILKEKIQRGAKLIVSLDPQNQISFLTTS